MTKRRYATYAALIGLVILAGCSKTQQENKAPVQVPGPAPQAVVQPAAPNVKSFAYYQKHLDEAKETWHQCQQVKPEEITEEIRARCEAAQTAWSTQPYKPGSR